MPRRTRMYLSGFTYHIVQRGNNRAACFFDQENYLSFIQLMREVKPRYGVDIHAWCLMTNHVHLLLTPQSDTGISNLMKVVCSRYAQFINKHYLRTGTLWEGRHKGSAVESRTYLLKCYRYIELNPVAAKMVSHPAEYRWSSYAANAWGENDQLITPHEEYLELSADRHARQARYRELFNSRLTDKDVNAIRKAAHYSMPLGSRQFLEQLETRLGRPLGQASHGRPRQRTG